MFQIKHDLDSIADEVRADIRESLSTVGKQIVQDVKSSSDYKGNVVKNDTIATLVSDTELHISNDNPIAGYLEFGTEPHVIEAKRAPVLVFEANGSTVFTKRVNHPGNKAYHTIENAFDDGAEHLERLLSD